MRKDFVPVVVFLSLALIVVFIGLGVQKTDTTGLLGAIRRQRQQLQAMPVRRVGTPDQYPPPEVTGMIDVDTSRDPASTICNPKWSTKSIRPPVSYTNPIKVKDVARYNQLNGTHWKPSDGELDHLISLELGGSPSSTLNLWFEPGKIPNQKDKVENYLNSSVCRGEISLGEAQREITSDWVKVLMENHL